MPARRAPPLPPRWFEITVFDTNNARVRKMFDLVAAAARDPECRTTVEQIVVERKAEVRRRRGRYWHSCFGPELVPVNAYKIRIERIPDVPTQPTNQKEPTHADQT